MKIAWGLLISFWVLAGTAYPQSCPGNAGCPNLAFGTAGLALNDVSPADGYEFINEIEMQPDGKFVGTMRIFDYPVPGGQVFNVVRFQTDGSLDPTFGGDGVAEIAFTPSADSEWANSMALQPDGKIVAVGCSPLSNGYRAFAITRVNADGTVDAGFGSNGRVQISFASRRHSCASTVAVQPDGAIVVGGIDGDNTWAFARLNVSGGLDPTFNGAGKLSISLRKSTDLGFIGRLLIQSDGKILVAGTAPSVRGTGRDAALVRLNANGSLDSGFGGSGKVFTDFYSAADSAYDMKIDASNRIVISGRAQLNGSDLNSYRMCLARYNSSGVLDADFGSAGRVAVGPNGMNSDGSGIAIQPDGKIVVGGVVGTNVDTLLARFNPDGSPDIAFGLDGNGRTVNNFFGELDVSSDVLILPDGNILVAGGTYGGPSVLASYVH